MLQLGKKSDLGRVRSANEDYCHAGLWQLMGEYYGLLAVADGIGGHRAGDVASQTAVSSFTQEVGRLLNEEKAGPSLALELAFSRANQAVYELSAADRRYAGMGTTLTAGLVWQGHLYMAHVGDTRLYLCRQGDCTALTDDHSLVGELIKSGGLSEEEAQNHPQRNLLTRALGTGSLVKVDQKSIALEPGDLIMLCSDGMHTLLNKQRMMQIIGESPDPQAAADQLVLAANQAGGHDNITVVLARWGWNQS